MAIRILILTAALLLPACANPECFEPVHTAAERGDAAELANLLAEDRYQADAEDKCHTKIRPLMLAANAGSVAAVRTLLEAGASTNVAHEGNGVTPLIAAAVTGNAEMVRLLLDRRADPDLAEARNWTAVCFAAQYGHRAVVEQLIGAGADLGWHTAAGLTPWMLALDAQRDPPPDLPDGRAEDYTKILEALVAAGAPHGEASSLHLVGSLPLSAIAKAGVPDGPALQTKLRGTLRFLKVVAGIDPQQAAAHEAVKAATSGTRGKVDAEGGVDVQQHAVGSGPMALYAGQRPGERETYVLKFDASPGSMVWQLVGTTPDDVDANGKARGNLYLRGIPTEPSDEEDDGGSGASSSSSNYLDPCNVAKWEVAVVEGGRESGGATKWLTTKLRLVRGEAGARKLARHVADEQRQQQRRKPPAAAPPPRDADADEEIGVYKEEL